MTNSGTPAFQRSLDSSTGSAHGRKLERGAEVSEAEGPKSHFFARTEAMARARMMYLKEFVGGTFLVILTIFAVFPIFWGSLWKIPDHPLNGWVVVRNFTSRWVGESDALVLGL
jgi:hypothetical protein